MSEQNNTIDQPAGGNGHGEPTQIGSTEPPAPMTRAMPAVARSSNNSAQRERITTLVAALGDIEHPLHQEAIQDLVAVGDAAVPMLNEALNPRRPWLASFRAAEALGQIGDGRATSALIGALRHPNSNVRWSAVRALATIGDARAMLDLRRLAREDRAKTTWGESVAGAAQSALDQMQSQNVLFRSAELVKTALACVLMLVALVVAYSLFTTLRNDLQNIGNDPVDQAALFAPLTPTPDPDVTPTSAADATTEPTAQPTAESGLLITAEPLVVTTNEITGTAVSVANVRSAPTSQTQPDNKIGSLNPGDEVIFMASSSDSRWYRIRLGQKHRDSSRIDSADGSGWVAAQLLSAPSTSLPIEQANTNTESPTPTP